MKNKLSLCIIALTLLICIMPFSLAETETYQVNTPVDLKFRCTLNNAIPSASTTLNFTINYPNGTAFIDNKLATPLGQGYFNYSTTFTKIGNYPAVIFCTDGTYSYSNSGSYDITETGEAISESFGLILGQLGIIALFIVISFAFDKKRWKIRSLFHMAALFIGIILLNSIRIIAGSSSSLSSMGNIGLIAGIIILVFMFLFILINYLIELFGYFKNKRRMRWETNEQT